MIEIVKMGNSPIKEFFLVLGSPSNATFRCRHCVSSNQKWQSDIYSKLFAMCVTLIENNNYAQCNDRKFKQDVIFELSPLQKGDEEAADGGDGEQQTGHSQAGKCILNIFKYINNIYIKCFKY